MAAQVSPPMGGRLMKTTLDGRATGCVCWAKGARESPDCNRVGGSCGAGR
jgi:hypothetical protein